MQFEEEYIKILEKELIPAMGCTEPSAVALAAAKAREVLGVFPDFIEVKCSGDIVKNVQGVIIPHTGNRRGIHVAAIAGALCGSSEKGLEILEGIPEEKIPEIGRLSETDMCTVACLDSESPLEIQITEKAGEDEAEVCLRGKHTNIVYVAKNKEILLQKKECDGEEEGMPEHPSLTIDRILDFAENVEISKVQNILDRQIQCNSAIAKEGLRNHYGASVGKTIFEKKGISTEDRAKAYAAAGSDARMSGCELPVVINCGSGNQGLTVSLPVLVYAKELGAEDEKLYKALVISNLTALHVKARIGRLSAFCGVVGAASGAGAAITYLFGGDAEMIKTTITNILGTISGMVCDGAKPSCAAKIAAAVDTALMSVDMALKKRGFHSGEGLVKKDIEKTIESIGHMARFGMRQTDQEVLKLVLDEV